MKKTVNNGKMTEFVNDSGDICVKIENIPNFIPSDIFECGQCFRFNAISPEYYEGVAFGKYIRVKKSGSDIIFENVFLNDIENIWYDYFDLGRDYGEIILNLSKDETLKKAFSLCTGIRILKQAHFETAVSFIISQNNNIPRIKKIVETLCREFGEKIIYKDKIFYSFPSAERLINVTQENLDMIKAGFRTKYILDFLGKIKNNDISLSEIENMTLQDASDYLRKVKGIGVKVAACILLYGYNRLESVPVDVWIKKVTEKYYPNKEETLGELFGKYAGIAQQYLFYYERTLNRNME